MGPLPLHSCDTFDICISCLIFNCRYSVAIHTIILWHNIILWSSTCFVCFRQSFMCLINKQIKKHTPINFIYMYLSAIDVFLFSVALCPLVSKCVLVVFEDSGKCVLVICDVKYVFVIFGKSCRCVLVIFWKLLK